MINFTLFMNRIICTRIALSFFVALLTACQGPQSIKPKELVANIVSQDQSLQSKQNEQLNETDEFLSEYAAVILALRNNPTFQAQLTELEIAQADLQLASQFSNPSVFYAFGVANKPYRYAIEFPLEALLLRPLRLKQMQAQSKQTQLQLMQTGFSLVRDARVAYAQAVISQEKVKRLEEALSVNNTITRLAKTRESLGDTSAQDSLIAENEMLLVERDLQSARIEARIANTQLMHMLNHANETRKLSLSDALLPSCSAEDISQLKTAAISSRSDVLAAEAAIMAVKEKRRLNGLNWLAPAAIADATSGQSNGHVLAPALRFNLPIFNQNQGQVERIDAELLKTMHEAEASKLKASLDIQVSQFKYQRDCQEWQQLQTALLPNSVQVIHDAETAYQNGEIAYLSVLESTRKYLNLKLRETQLKADMILSWSDLMRSTSTSQSLTINHH
jgi:outer membrane protein, heavy metal efflux system